MTRSARLNARLTPDLAERLERARALSKKSTTEIVHEALSAYCDAALDAVPVGAILAEVGLVGCAEGPADSSTRTKEAFADGLRGKAKRRRT
jgi:hypothetical protein